MTKNNDSNFFKQDSDDKIDSINNLFFTFYSSDQLFGIPITHVIQIIQMQPFTPIPEFPEYVKGVISFRDGIIPIVDIRMRLKQEPKEYDDCTCIVVCKIDEIYVGFIIDSPCGVEEILPESIKEKPELSNHHITDYIMGIAKVSETLVMLLDSSKIISNQDRMFIDKKV